MTWTDSELPVHLSEGSEVLADSACTDYLIEEMLSGNRIRLLASRKSNSKRPHNPCTEYLISTGIKRVETAFSDIASADMRRCGGAKPPYTRNGVYPSVVRCPRSGGAQRRLAAEALLRQKRSGWRSNAKYMPKKIHAVT